MRSFDHSLANPAASNGEWARFRGSIEKYCGVFIFVVYQERNGQLQDGTIE
jgi:hypothetical protein